MSQQFEDDYESDNCSTTSDYDELNVIVATFPWPRVDKPKHKFQIYRRSEFTKPPGVRWLVKGLILDRKITVLYGAPKRGKSLILHSIACTATAEYPSEAQRRWCGFEARKEKILYVAAEGFSGLLGREDSWTKIHMVRVSENLAYLRTAINYFSETDDIGRALRELKAQDFCPDYVMVDTLSRSMVGGNERDEKDIMRVYTHAEEFCGELGDAGMAFAHHSTKDEKNYRGSVAIFGLADGLIECTSERRSGVLQITLTSKGFKDASDFEPVTVECETRAVDTEEGLQEIPAVKRAVSGEPVTGAIEVTIEAVFNSLFQGKGATFTDIYKAVDSVMATGRRAKHADRNDVSAALGNLVAMGKVSEPPDKGTKGALYRWIQPQRGGRTQPAGASEEVRDGEIGIGIRYRTKDTIPNTDPTGLRYSIENTDKIPIPTEDRTERQDNQIGAEVPIPEKAGSVPFMVTLGMKEQLRGLGFGEEQIRGMTPEEAWGHITGSPQAGASAPSGADLIAKGTAHAKGRKPDTAVKAEDANKPKKE
jgi:hypothetical protein